jgi:uncharacterized protein YqjF (DUF2071 family)
MSATFLTANWEKLIMINYEVEENVLLPYVPIGTVLDTFEGKHFVSIVGFLFLNTAVFKVKWPFHTNFEEVNLRFYVKRQEGEKIKRAAVFIKEIVPKRMITWLANSIYNENYERMPMKHSLTQKTKENQLEYAFKKNNVWNKILVNYAIEGELAKTNSIEEFISEHYWGYAKGKNLTTEYEVQHPKWNIHHVIKSDINIDFKTVFGNQFQELNGQNFHSIFVADGSAISVLKGKKIYNNKN